jgi:hypothetical protein
MAPPLAVWGDSPTLLSDEQATVIADDRMNELRQIRRKLDMCAPSAIAPTRAGEHRPTTSRMHRHRSNGIASNE